MAALQDCHLNKCGHLCKIHLLILQQSLAICCILEIALVYLALHANEEMSGPREAVNLYLDIKHINLSTLLATVWLCGSAKNRAVKTWCR